MGDELKAMDDDICKALLIFRTSAKLGDEELFRTLVNQGMKKKLAARLVEFLPIAYCRLILRSTGARFSNAFRRVQPNGETQQQLLSSDPIWRGIVRFADAEVDRGVQGKDLLLVAARSAEFHAANQLLNDGSKLENIAFASPVLMWPEEGPPLESPI